MFSLSLRSLMLMGGVLLLHQNLCTASSPSQQRDTLELVDSVGRVERVDPLRLGIVTGLSAGGFVLGHVVLTELWWNGERVPFHFNWQDDWRYALGADKLGHAIMPYIGTDLYRQGLEWTGLDRTTSLWIAASLSWGYTTYVEVRDGFSQEWGFSWGDMIANSLGIGWRVAEGYLPAMERVRFKVSYWASDAYRAGLYGSIIDDYESTYHWASFDPELFLPDAWGDAWPDWLNLSLGHTVEGVVDYDGSGQHLLHLSLDLDTEGLPGEGAFWGWLKRTLNYYHFPTPGLRFGRGLVIR